MPRRLIRILLVSLLLVTIAGPVVAHAQREAMESADAGTNFLGGWGGGAWRVGGLWGWLSSLFAPEHGQIIPLSAKPAAHPADS